MSRVDSPVWDDVMRVWLDPQGVVRAGQRDGRSLPDGWRAIALYTLGFVFSIVLHQRLGADRMLDAVLGISNAGSVNPGLEATVLAAGIGAFVTLFLVQWLFLPVVSRGLGGSRLRQDANLAVYFMFCAGFLSGFAAVLVDVAALVSQRLLPPSGGYVVLAGSLAVIVMTAHQCARLIMTALGLPTYPRALVALLVSLVGGLLAAALFFAIVLTGTLAMFPEMLE